jgi:2-isopropylmalate synthase
MSEELTSDDRVMIFDTTLRDGEQAPGVSLNTEEKLLVARQLDRLKVDVIEAGYPMASPGDFEAVQRIARADLSEGHPRICAIARAHTGDIARAWDAIKDATRPRIHIFLSTSEIHMRHQLNATPEDVKGLAHAAVAQAKEECEDVEFSPMDATRSDIDFVAEVVAIALQEGATTINVPDTVGYATPDEYGEVIRRLYALVPSLDGVVVSAHCHNDLGLAVANTLAGVQAGARQVECAINGIGERAGNASLEELVMLLHTRREQLRVHTGVDTTQLTCASRLVSRLTGFPVQPNKAIVGSNAFAHESGVHQDGVLKERLTYQIMDARTVGLEANSIVLGKHSGRHALQQALRDLGHTLQGGELNRAFVAFKEVADEKKRVTEEDLESIAAGLRGDEAATPEGARV